MTAPLGSPRPPPPVARPPPRTLRTGESASDQVVDAATEAPAEGAEVTEAAQTAEDAGDRESGSVQAVEAADEAPAEGADDETAK